MREAKKMQLICESNDLLDYLNELEVVNYHHPLIQEKIAELFYSNQTEKEKVKIAFEFVRDCIDHSWDIQSEKVTCSASEVLAEGEGICYAKSNLLAALLRSQGIPTGFCYQRLMLFDTPEQGFCIHALNAVYLRSLGKWIRLDARGNKEGIDAQFSITQEKVAFDVQTNQGEIDYPMIYVEPHHKTLSALKAHTNALKMYKNHLPDSV